MEDIERDRPRRVHVRGGRQRRLPAPRGRCRDPKETKELLGEKRDYLTIKILHNDMTVTVPCENAHRAGLRRVITRSR